MSAAIPKASYKLEVGWGQTTSGLFTFGISKFGSSTDLLAADSWSRGFAGPYDNITIDALDMAITRGRDDTLTTIQAGQITSTLRDYQGRYNPDNAASPIAAYLDTDKPVRASATLAGVTYPLYYGFLTDIEADPSNRGRCILTGVDFLDKLDRQNPLLQGINAPPAGSSTGTIIGAILDWFYWTEPALRSLGVGDTILAQWTLANGQTSGLQLIGDLLNSERGIVFVNAAGAVTYIDRHTRYMTSTSAGTIDRVMTAFPVGRSNQNTTNQWIVQRTDMAGNNVGAAQTWPDPAAGLTPSQQLHGIISQTLTTAFLNSDSQALALAQFLVMRTGTTNAHVYEVPINIADQATFIQVLSRDLGDRVTMTIQPRNMPQISGDFYIESIAHTVQTSGSPRHACVWRVSKAPSVNPFRFGVSKFGGADALWY